MYAAAEIVLNYMVIGRVEALASKPCHIKTPESFQVFRVSWPCTWLDNSENSMPHRLALGCTKCHRLLTCSSHHAMGWNYRPKQGCDMML